MRHYSLQSKLVDFGSLLSLLEMKLSVFVMLQQSWLKFQQNLHESIRLDKVWGFVQNQYLDNLEAVVNWIPIEPFHMYSVYWILWHIFRRQISPMMTYLRKFKKGWYIITKGNLVLFKSFSLVSLMFNLTFIISEWFLGHVHFTNKDHILSFVRSKSLSLEHSLLMCKVSSKTKYKKWKYWWCSVGLTCKSVTFFPSCNFTFMSKIGIFLTLTLWLNFRYWLRS